MQRIASFFAALAASPVFAATVVVEAPCSPTPWLESTRPNAAGQNLGQVTLDALTAAHLPYLGTASGIQAINGTVTGSDALEILSDTEMRAYGWCFSLNGVEPDRMPDEVVVSTDADEIRWYFGFAHYKDGAWVSYCTKTNRALPPYICARP